MRSTLALFAVLAIIGLGQAHGSLIQELPGEGPLHDDIVDILKLVPTKKITKIALEYLAKDPEVQAAFRYLTTTTIIKDFLIDFEAIPEVINLLNYLQREGVDIYTVLNSVNKIFDIEEIVPPPVPYAYIAVMKKTGGLKGLFKDIMKQFKYDDYITIYVKKMKTSPAFVGFIDQLKSDNFQQVVNKVFEIKSFQTILNGLKNSGVNLRIVADIMFIVLGIDVPSQPSYGFERTLEEEFFDFWKLISLEKFLEIILTYFEGDQEVQNAMQFMYTSEFHILVRAVEALKEHQALVMYMHKAGFNMAKYIQSFHETVGMEDYVPPKEIENIFRSEIGVQKVGGGMKAMLEDLSTILPLAEINNLHQEKLRTSKSFSYFIEMLKAPKMQKIIVKLTKQEAYKELNRRSEEKGLLLEDLTKFFFRTIGFN
ncbi:uncharacterized protein LOC105288125 [Ooceraea biroi]|uniref:Protein G12 n=1 Tax=Ooceraea biroi TaxID=2015173 RepID=A0A026WX23_OOCBI|nr:uncharacterized protein LOC105288125 [Ooceraea biroi]EZA60592.1 Protein G12 [Ooceraea biroi]